MYYVIFVILIVHSSLQAYIYELSVMRGWNARTKRYHYILSCGDWHDRSEKSTIHRQYFDYLFTHINPRMITLIVEDLSSQRGNNRALCNNFVLNTQGGVLGGIAYRAQRCGIHVENIEYRYCRVAAVAPVYKMAHTMIDPATITSARSIMMKSLIDELVDACDYLQTVLPPALKKEVDAIYMRSKQLQWERYEHESVASYLVHNAQTPKMRKSLMYTMLTFDTHIFDLRMLISVLQHAEKPYLMMISGGTHTHNVCRWLERLGYERIFHIPASFKSHITPISVDITQLNKFLPF